MIEPSLDIAFQTASSVAQANQHLNEVALQPTGALSAALKALHRERDPRATLKALRPFDGRWKQHPLAFEAPTLRAQAHLQLNDTKRALEVLNQFGDSLETWPHLLAIRGALRGQSTLDGTSQNNLTTDGTSHTKNSGILDLLTAVSALPKGAPRPGFAQLGCFVCKVWLPQTGSKSLQGILRRLPSTVKKPKSFFSISPRPACLRHRLRSPGMAIALAHDQARVIGRFRTLVSCHVIGYSRGSYPTRRPVRPCHHTSLLILGSWLLSLGVNLEILVADAQTQRVQGASHGPSSDASQGAANVSTCRLRRRVSRSLRRSVGARCQAPVVSTQGATGNLPETGAPAVLVNARRRWVARVKTQADAHRRSHLPSTGRPGCSGRGQLGAHHRTGMAGPTAPIACAADPSSTSEKTAPNDCRQPTACAFAPPR